MNRFLRPLSGLALALAALPACNGNSGVGPYDTGLTVTTEAEQTRVTRFFSIRESDEQPRERKDTLGFGVDCAEARGSAGTLTITEVGTATQRWSVIGQTESSHPLAPGADTYGAVGVSVVESNASFGGHATTVETFRAPGASPSSWEQTTDGDVARDTRASFQGIAADEYVVSLSSLGDLWTDLESDESNLAMNLITRHNPQAQDIWSSLDGSMLYIADTSEELTVAGEKVQAMRVDVLTVADPDPTVGSLVDKCISESVSEFVTTHPDFEDGTLRTAHLDTGCENAFVHQELGSEWWYNNVLIQSSKTQYEVEIIDYGYEWFENNGTSCTRVTSPTRDDPDAELFIDYSVTEIVTEMHATGYEVVTE